MPDGLRIYAVGDIHGQFAQFRELIAQIDADDAGRPSAEVHLVLLGDLIDRGPQSAETVEYALQLARNAPNVHLLMGNHEEVFVAAANGDRASARSLIAMGGAATLRSYGFEPGEIDAGSFQDLADLMTRRIPREHVAFLGAGGRLLQFGDYIFVHAGIRPGVNLNDQADNDLRWIRRQFLHARREDGWIVVHGHTPTHEIDVDLDHGRIGIDTFAYETGVLTAIGLEGDAYWFLQAAGDPADSRPVAREQRTADRLDNQPGCRIVSGFGAFSRP